MDEGEYFVRPSHSALAAGPVDLYPVDLGMDAHDMSIRDQAGSVLGSVAVAPGQTAHIQIDLAPGTYTLFCSLYNHEQLGMRATLTVN